jgi:hypothetical protein
VLLNFGYDAKSTHLETSGFKKDTAGEINRLDKNSGMLARRIKNSKQLELYGRLHTDISFQNRYIINTVDIVLRLIRNQSSLCLMEDGVNINELFIDEATLHIRQVKISRAVMLHSSIKSSRRIKFTSFESNNSHSFFYPLINSTLAFSF